MTEAARPRAEDFTAGRPVVFRNGTVITVDSAGVLENADVLRHRRHDRRPSARSSTCPRARSRSTRPAASSCPGMIDTHRHMWQTALRGYGGDWALSQYFVFYYLHLGRGVPPRGHLRRQPAQRARVGRHRRHDDARLVARAAHARVRRGRAAGVPRDPRPIRARLRQLPRRAVGVVERARVPRASSASNFSAPERHARPAARLRRPRRRGLPRAGAFEAARDLGLRVTTHAGVWGATTDTGIDQMYDAGFMTDKITYVHASSLSARELPEDRRDRRHGLGRDRERAERRPGLSVDAGRSRKYGITTSLSMDTSVWWSADFFSAMRATLSAYRSRDHLEAHAQGRDDQRQPAARRGRRVDGDDGRRELARHGGQDRVDHARARRPTCC